MTPGLTSGLPRYGGDTAQNGDRRQRTAELNDANRNLCDLGYGAPHLSARRTSTLLNNALLNAHSRIVDLNEVISARGIDLGRITLVLYRRRVFTKA
jgi:hypothetical protein